MAYTESELYEILFPEKAQALREALEIQQQIIASIKHFNETFFTKDIFGEPIEPAKPAVKTTHIGTITKFGRYYNAKVLANHGREVIAACSRESEAEAIAFTESKYAVEWVLSNRFDQEVACL
jgi:hypothetical protein